MKKYRSKTTTEDPLQHHAKPKDLSSNGLPIPVEMPIRNIDDILFSTNSFASCKLDPKLVTTLESNEGDGGLGLLRTTGIQNAVIPLLMKRNQNIFVKSQTGSGKTLSYLIPIFHDLMTLDPKLNRKDGTRALVIAPTRELCQQISDIIAKLSRCCVWIVGGCISGGEKRKSEKARLRKGITILVGTPGRLLDHLKTTESFNLTNLRWIVLDEADRLLDMGIALS